MSQDIQWNLKELFKSISMADIQVTGCHVLASPKYLQHNQLFIGPRMIPVFCVSAQNGSISACYSAQNLIKYILHYWQAFLTVFSGNYFVLRLYKTLLLRFFCEGREGDEKGELSFQPSFQNLLLTTTFCSFSLAYAAASPPSRHSPRA